MEQRRQETADNANDLLT